MKVFKPQRGEVWFAELDPTRGREQAKKRPCIIISVNGFNQGPAQLVIAIPLTTKFGNKHGYISLIPPEGGVAETSYVLCEQIRVLSHDRLGNAIGSVSEETLLGIEYRVKLLLGFSIRDY